MVTVLGLGEAGGRLASDLVSLGVDVRSYDPDPERDAPSTTRTSDAASAAAGSDVVLSVNSARAAFDAAKACLPALGADGIYADLNTGSPELKRRLATLVGGAGARFADVALLGPIPTRGLQAPVLASGDGARAFAQLFEPLGMPVEVISKEAGDAAGLKLVRSVFMKGLAAAVVESMQAAERGRACRLARRRDRGDDRPTVPRASARGKPEACRTTRRRDASRARPARRARSRAQDRVRERSAARRARGRGARRALVTTQPPAAAAPSDRARGLVEGAYDLHVHVAPDVPVRRIDDHTLARRFADLGLAGFALKSHYTSTAERAQVVSALVPGVDVLGTLTLNWAVGGMNALAVEIAAREGARIVWMPTVDSPAETAGRDEPKEGDKVPQWARLQHELRGLGLSIDAVHVTDTEGRLLPAARDVLRAIARNDLVLATGHLSRDDTFAVVEGALEEGVDHVVVTHPEFPCQNFSLDDQRALADRGCLLERCLSTPLSGKTEWEHVFDGVRAVGIERSLFSSDCGNPDYPPVEDGLALWADRLLGGGFGEDEVREMIVGQSRRLVGAA